MKKKILTIVLGMMVIAGLLLLWQTIQAKTIKTNKQIKTVKVTRKNLAKVVSASGKVASNNEVELKFQTSGQLVWVGVKLGDTVKPWQAIAQLDKRELELNLKKYLKDYLEERWDQDEDLQVTYRNEVLTDTIKRILDKNQFDLDKAVMDVELKDIALKFATLVTPIGGLVTQVDTPVAGINITPSTAVFKVADPNDLVFKADVDEVDIGKVTEGQKVKIFFDAYPDKPYEGYVSRVDFVAKATSGGGTAFTVEVKLPENSNLKYKLGMNGDVEIIEAEEYSVLSLPIETIHTVSQEKFVYLLKDGQLIKNKVKTGLETDTDVEITAGVNEGEIVILSGFELLNKKPSTKKTNK